MVIPEKNLTHFSLVLFPKTLVYQCSIWIYFNALNNLLNSSEYLVTTSDLYKNKTIRIILKPAEEEKLALKLLFNLYKSS